MCLPIDCCRLLSHSQKDTLTFLTFLSRPDLPSVSSGTSFTVTVWLTSHADVMPVPVPHAPVSLDWLYLVDGAKLGPLPQIVVTDANGTATFNITVQSAIEDTDATLVFRSVALLDLLFYFRMSRYRTSYCLAACCLKGYLYSMYAN